MKQTLDLTEQPYFLIYLFIEDPFFFAKFFIEDLSNLNMNDMFCNKLLEVGDYTPHFRTDISLLNHICN
jgi:hypothetical protein